MPALNVSLIYLPQKDELLYRIERPGGQFNIGCGIELVELYRQAYQSPAGNYARSLEFSPLTVYLAAGPQVWESFFLEARIGYALGTSSSRFSDFEVGGFMRYFVGDNRQYIIGGVLFHSNGGESHGTSIYVSTYEDTFLLLGIGAGLRIADVALLDLMYYYPVEKEYGYTTVSFPSYARYDKNLYGVFKLAWSVYL